MLTTYNSNNNININKDNNNELKDALNNDNNNDKLFDKVGVLKVMISENKWDDRTIAYSNISRCLYSFQSGDKFKQYVEHQIPSFVEKQIILHNTNIFLVNYVHNAPTEWIFEIALLDSSFFLCAESEEMMQEWVLTFASTGVPLKTPHKPTKESFEIPAARIYGMQGFLEKRGVVNKAFKRRFFRTIENASGHLVLAYYMKSNVSTPKGIIKLEGAQIRHKIETNPDPSPLDIILITQDRSFVLKAEDPVDKRLWFAVLQAIIDGKADRIFVKEFALEKKGPPKDGESLEGYTFYEMLQIPPWSSAQEIQKAFKRAAKRYHPDRDKSPTATDNFHLVSEAFEVLSNATTRKDYNAELALMEGLTREELEEEWQKQKAEQIKAEEVDVHVVAPGENKMNDDKVESVESLAELDEEKFYAAIKDMCEICLKKPKSLFCFFCNQDMCLACSQAQHELESCRRHKRIKINKKEEFLEKVNKPGTKEYEDAEERRVDIMKSMEETGIRSHQLPSVHDLVKEAQIAEEEKALPLHQRRLSADMRASSSNINVSGNNISNEILADEKEVDKENEDSNSIEKMLQKLASGVDVYKMPTGMFGDADLRRMYVKEKEKGRFVVTWDTKKKGPSPNIPIKGMQLVRGNATHKTKFRKQFSSRSKFAFTLVSPLRMLDIVTQNEKDYKIWTSVIEYLTSQQL